MTPSPASAGTMAEAALAAGIEEGLVTLRPRLDAELRAGEEQVGWKLGFGSAAGLAALALDGPVVGYLLGRGKLPNGSRVPLSGWTAPVVEPEIVAWIGTDMPAGTPAHEVQGYVHALAPAIELADVAQPSTDVRQVLAGNIFHRHYILGEPDTSVSLSDAEALAALVTQTGQRLVVTSPSELTGRFADVLARTARLAPYLGRAVRAGDIVLMGSIVTPIPVAAGAEVAYAWGAFPELSVSFED
jgi:2-keto-4-pentenoate hydratase